MHHIIQIATGSEHIVVLTSEQEVFGWGVNSEGQVSTGCLLDCLLRIILSIAWTGTHKLCP